MPSRRSLRTLRPSAWKFKTGNNPVFSTCDRNVLAASWMNLGRFSGIGMSRSCGFFGLDSLDWKASFFRGFRDFLDLEAPRLPAGAGMPGGETVIN